MRSVHPLHQFASIPQADSECQRETWTAGAHAHPLQQPRQDMRWSRPQPVLRCCQTGLLETLFMEPSTADRPGHVGMGSENSLTHCARVRLRPNLGDRRRTLPLGTCDDVSS